MATMDDLPEIMLTEILIRLQVISLLIGKCVCKTWLSIISNPNFIRSQLRRSNINPTLLTLLKPDQQPQQLHQDFDKSIHFKSIVVPSLFKITRSFRCCFIGTICLSTYNGIICLANFYGDVVYLWNPSIGKCKKLPAPIKTSFTPKLGFGYDSISDDYKVVRIIHGYDSRVQVYSTNADTWTQYETRILNNVDVYDTSNAVVNGVLYLGNGFDDIISFDLHNEVIGLVPLPLFSRENWMSNIMDFQGSVAIIFQSGLGIFELWTLEGVPAHMSWTKKFNIRTDSEIWLLCYLGVGQFCGVNLPFRTHFLYDYESEEIKYCGPVEPKACAALKYSETLVSLNWFEPVKSVRQLN